VKTLAIVLATASALVPSAAIAQEGPSARPVDHRVEMWRGELGYRGAFINSAGYEPFSPNHYFTQVSLALSRTVATEGSYSFAPGIAYDSGGSSSDARKQTTSLSVQRLSVPLEGRMHFGPWGYAFLRAAPGAAYVSAQVDDASSPSVLKKADWMFSTDFSAGYAFLVTPRFNRTEQKVRLWLQADVGYGWVAGDRLALAPSTAATQGLGASGVDLGTLAMEGGFFRLAAAVSF
jgi:hypothetical protein